MNTPLSNFFPIELPKTNINFAEILDKRSLRNKYFNDKRGSKDVKFNENSLVCVKLPN